MRYPLTILVFSLLIPLAQAQDAKATRYHDLLRQRPHAQTTFERFVNTWLETSSHEDLATFLADRAKAANAIASDHLLVAMLAERRLDDDTALAALDEALKLDPADVLTWLAKAKVHMRRQDYTAVLATLDKAPANPGASETDLARTKALALLRQQKSTEALQVLKGLAAKHPDDDDLAEEMVELLFSEGLVDPAIESSRALIARTRDPYARAVRQLRLGDILGRTQKKEEALVVFESVLASAAQDSWIEDDVLTRISAIYRREDDISALGTKLEALAKANPQRSAVAWLRGRVLGELGERDQAVKVFRAVLESNPSRRDLRESYLEQLITLGQTKAAIEQAEALRALQPQDREIVFRIAALHHEVRDDAAAERTLDEALKMPGASEGDHLRVARTLEQWLKDSAALRAYERTAQAFPDSPSVQEALAAFLVAHDQKERGLKLFRQCVASGSVEDVVRIGQTLTMRREVRAAQDMLATREKDFAREPRYLAAMITFALANKEQDTAIRLTRARLLLMRDFNEISFAIKQAISALREPASVEKAVQELQAQNVSRLPIQERCLLAQMLEDTGKADAVEPLLATAAAQDQFVATSQLVQLLSARQDFARATAAVQRLFDLPGGHTAANVQKLVQLHRQNSTPDKALSLIPEWKKLAPASIQPWLEESKLLMEQEKREEALKGLRTAARKFDKDTSLQAELARTCIQAGRADEAATIYLRLYELTEDPSERLRYVALLAEAAGISDRLPGIISNFEERQRGNRGSALPWLALAELHVASGNDEERRRCLYEASRLRPKDLGLLKEIARIEEASGLFKEAISTLTAASKLDVTSRTTEEIARLNIENGDVDVGYRMLAQLAGGDKMDARQLEQMADGMCGAGEWERARSFLASHLSRFPKDYRLHYLHAVTLEEIGKDSEALDAFFGLLAFDEEIPGVSAAVLSANPFDITARYDASLPAQAKDWLQLLHMKEWSYAHRLGDRNAFASRRSFSLRRSNASGATNAGFVGQAPNLKYAGLMAMGHIVELSAAQNPAQQQQTAARLAQTGVQDADVLLQWQSECPNATIDEALLARHPGHQALHSLWLITQGMRQDAEPDLLWKCFQMFKSTMPDLAFTAGARAITADTPDRETKIKEVLAHGAQVSGASLLIAAVANLLVQFSDPETGAVSGLSAEAVKGLALLAKQRAGSDPQLSLAAIPVLATAGLWKDLIDVMETAFASKAEPAKGSPLAIQSSRVRYSYNVPLPCPFSELGVNPVPMFRSREEQEERESTSLLRQQETAQKVGGLLSSIKTPGARMLIELMMVDPAGPLLAADIQRRLARPAPTAGDYSLAGWFAQFQGQWPEACAHFEKAHAATNDKDVQANLNSAIFFAVMRGGQNEQAVMLPFVKALIERERKRLLQTQERALLIELANQFDLNAEAGELSKLTVSKQAIPGRFRSLAPNTPPPTTAINPYSGRSFSQPSTQRTSSEQIEANVKAGRRDAALSGLVSLLRTTGNDWLVRLGGDRRSAQRQLTNLQNGLLKKDSSLLDTALQQISASAIADTKCKAEYAAVLEILNRSEEARHAYNEVPDSHSLSPAVLERLIVQGADTDAVLSLGYLKRIPASSKPLALRLLVNDLTGNDELTSTHQRQHIARVLALWLNQLADSGSKLPKGAADALLTAPRAAQMGSNRKGEVFPSLYEPQKTGTMSPMREVHDALCRALCRFPETSQEGFAALAGLALADGSDTQEVYDLALQVLKTRAGGRRIIAGSALLNASNDFSFESKQRVARPSAAHMAVRGAVLQSNVVLETQVLPLIRAVEGPMMEQDARAYALLFTCPEPEFPLAAKAWAMLTGQRRQLSPRTQGEGGRLSEVLRIWSSRQMKVRLDDLFVPSATDDTRGRDPFASFESISGESTLYAIELAKIAGEDALRAYVRKVRDQLLGNDAAVRQMRLRTFQRRQNDEFGQRSISAKEEQALQSTSNYKTWLTSLLDHPDALAALAIAEEDGLAEDKRWIENLARNINEGVGSMSVEKQLKLAESLGFLGDATTFRAHRMSKTHNQNWLESFAAIVDNNGRNEPFIKQLEARQPRTLGNDLTLSAVRFAHNQAVSMPVSIDTKAELETILRTHSSDLPKLSRSQSLDLASLIHRHLDSSYPDRPLSPGLAALIAPFMAAEKEALELSTKELRQILDWSQLPPEWQNFPEISTRLASLALSNREEAGQLLTHLSTLAKAPKIGGQNRRQEDDDNGRLSALLLHMAKVPDLFDQTLDAARTAGLLQSDSWCAQFADMLCESSVLMTMNNTEALFARSRLVAEAGTFVDFELRGSQVPTLLARILQAYCYSYSSDQKITSAHVVQILEKHAPSTFGSALIRAYCEVQAEARNLEATRNKSGPKPPPASNERAIADLILSRSAEFSKVNAEIAPCVLSFLESTAPLTVKTAPSADLRAALGGLYELCKQASATEAERWSKASTFAEVPVASHQAASIALNLLRRQALIDPDRAGDLLARITELFRTQDTKQRRQQGSISTEAAMWLQVALSIPALVPRTRALMHEAGFDSKPDYLAEALYRSLSAIQYPPNLTEHVQWLKHLHMLDDLPGFQSYPQNQERIRSSFLAQWQKYWANNKDLQKDLRALIQKQEPQTFGSSLLANLLSRETELNLDWLTPWISALNALPGAERDAIMEVLVPRPEDLDLLALCQPVLSPLLRGRSELQQQEAVQEVGLWLSAGNASSNTGQPLSLSEQKLQTFVETPGGSRTLQAIAKSISIVLRADPARGAKAFEIIARLLEQESPNLPRTAQGQPNYKSPSQQLMLELASYNAATLPLVLKTVDQQKLLSGPPAFAKEMGALLVRPKTIRSPWQLVERMDALGWLSRAEGFDTRPDLFPIFGSALETFVAFALPLTPELAAGVAQALENPKYRNQFGTSLMASLLLRDEIHDFLTVIHRHKEDLSKIAPRDREAIQSAARRRWPAHPAVYKMDLENLKLPDLSPPKAVPPVAPAPAAAPPPKPGPAARAKETNPPNLPRAAGEIRELLNAGKNEQASALFAQVMRESLQKTLSKGQTRTLGAGDSSLVIPMVAEEITRGRDILFVLESLQQPGCDLDAFTVASCSFGITSPTAPEIAFVAPQNHLQCLEQFLVPHAQPGRLYLALVLNQLAPGVKWPVPRPPLSPERLSALRDRLKAMPPSPEQSILRSILMAEELRSLAGDPLPEQMASTVLDVLADSSINPHLRRMLGLWVCNHCTAPLPTQVLNVTLALALQTPARLPDSSYANMERYTAIRRKDLRAAVLANEQLLLPDQGLASLVHHFGQIPVDDTWQQSVAPLWKAFPRETIDPKTAGSFALAKQQAGWDLFSQLLLLSCEGNKERIKTLLAMYGTMPACPSWPVATLAREGHTEPAIDWVRSTWSRWPLQDLFSMSFFDLRPNVALPVPASAVEALRSHCTDSDLAWLAEYACLPPCYPNIANGTIPDATRQLYEAFAQRLSKARFADPDKEYRLFLMVASACPTVVPTLEPALMHNAHFADKSRSPSRRYLDSHACLVRIQAAAIRGDFAGVAKALEERDLTNHTVTTSPLGAESQESTLPPWSLLCLWRYGMARDADGWRNYLQRSVQNRYSDRSKAYFWDDTTAFLAAAELIMDKPGSLKDGAPLHILGDVPWTLDVIKACAAWTSGSPTPIPVETRLRWLTDLCKLGTNLAAPHVLGPQLSTCVESAGFLTPEEVLAASEKLLKDESLRPLLASVVFHAARLSSEHAQAVAGLKTLLASSPQARESSGWRAALVWRLIQLGQKELASEELALLERKSTAPGTSSHPPSWSQSAWESHIRELRRGL